jgi:uncharacterized membrane protein
MGNTENVFVVVGVYDEKSDAEADFEVVKELHSAGLVGTYDAAVITKDDEGKVHVRRHEKPTERGALTGLGVGALVGLLFPPSLIGMGALGAAAGGVTGHLWKGLSRSDLKELGEALDDGEASLVVIGESKIEEAVKKELKRASKAYEKEIDAEAKELRKALDEAIDEAGK